MSILYTRTWPAAALRAAHPPRFTDPNKLAVVAVGEGPWAGEITVTRVGPAALPPAIPAEAPAWVLSPGPFTYGDDEPGFTPWHVNFADPELFFAYGGRLFAQDEVQATEHPALGSVREALLAEGLPARTLGPEGPTPVLVRGVERRIEVDTAPSLQNPGGLYGNRFTMAPRAKVVAATTALRPPTVSNLVAIAAPAAGQGAYSAAQLRAILVTAYTGFSAAVADSPGSVEVRTGFWGCVAFGGNRTVMTALQLLAARLAGVARLRFYAFDATGARDAEAGLAEFNRLLRPGTEPAAFLAALEARGHRWGLSDGN